MQRVRDTFLHLLHDNLDSAIPVHGMRRDVDDPSADTLRMNAVNVHFLNVDLDVHVSHQYAVVDIIHDKEVTAVEWVSAVWDILSAAFMTPLKDYSDTDDPQLVGTNIFWDRNSLKFRKVYSERYCHYTLTIPLKYNP